MRGGFGWWCESNDAVRFVELVSQITDSQSKFNCKKEFDFLNENYSADRGYATIIKHFVG